MEIAQILLLLCCLVVGALGMAHLVFTFIGTKLHPRSSETLQTMQATSPRISKETSMWKAWLGFNASHSFGVILFAAVFGYFAVANFPVFANSGYLQSLGAVTLVGYLILAFRYWFKVPLFGVSLGLALYVVSIFLAAA